MKIQKNILFQTENIHIVVNDQNTFDLARLGNSFTKMQKKDTKKNLFKTGIIYQLMLL